MDRKPADFLYGIGKHFCTHCACNNLSAKTYAQDGFPRLDIFMNKLLFQGKPREFIFIIHTLMSEVVHSLQQSGEHLTGLLCCCFFDPIPPDGGHAENSLEGKSAAASI